MRDWENILTQADRELYARNLYGPLAEATDTWLK